MQHSTLPKLNTANLKQAKTAVFFYHDREFSDTLKKEAQKRGVPVSRLLRQAVDSYLETEL